MDVILMAGISPLRAPSHTSVLYIHHTTQKAAYIVFVTALSILSNDQRAFARLARSKYIPLMMRDDKI